MSFQRPQHRVFQELAQLQHLKKFVEEVGSAEARQTRMIAGDSKISG
jgi:hypothetical protein